MPGGMGVAREACDKPRNRHQLRRARAPPTESHGLLQTQTWRARRWRGTSRRSMSRSTCTSACSRGSSSRRIRAGSCGSATAWPERASVRPKTRSSEVRLHRQYVPPWLHSTLMSTLHIGFSWEDLPQGSVLVDVGGGIGAQAVVVADAHPHIHAVVEGRAQVTSTAASVRPPLLLPLLQPLVQICLTFSDSGLGLTMHTSLRVGTNVLA